MKNNITKIIIFCLLSYTCKNRTDFQDIKTSSNVDSVIKKEELKCDKYNNKRVFQNVKFLPDTSINGICLQSLLNIEKYTNNNVDKKKNEIFQKIRLTNKNRTQMMIMYCHPGSYSNQFSEFEVFYLNKKSETFDKQVDEDVFKTENGIELGMSINEFKTIKGEPDSIVIKDNEVYFYYFIKDYKSSNFLKRYNLPCYYGEYVFRNDSLIRFKFGFEYP